MAIAGFKKSTLKSFYIVVKSQIILLNRTQFQGRKRQRGLLIIKTIKQTKILIFLGTKLLFINYQEGSFRNWPLP